MVVPYFHLMQGCSVFLFVVMPINCSCAWLGVGLALFPPYEVLACFPELTEQGFFVSLPPKEWGIWSVCHTIWIQLRWGYSPVTIQKIIQSIDITQRTQNMAPNVWNRGNRVPICKVEDDGTGVNFRGHKHHTWARINDPRSWQLLTRRRRFSHRPDGKGKRDQPAVGSFYSSWNSIRSCRSTRKRN